MEELLKSFNLFRDDEGYWFVSKDEYVKGDYIVSDYGNYVEIHTEVSVLDDFCWYSNMVKMADKKEIKSTLANVLKKRKELLVQMRLDKLQMDF